MSYPPSNLYSASLGQDGSSGHLQHPYSSDSGATGGVESPHRAGGPGMLRRPSPPLHHIINSQQQQQQQQPLRDDAGGAWNEHAGVAVSSARLQPQLPPYTSDRTAAEGSSRGPGMGRGQQQQQQQQQEGTFPWRARAPSSASSPPTAAAVYDGRPISTARSAGGAAAAQLAAGAVLTAAPPAATFDIDLSGFRLRVADPDSFPPPYSLRLRLGDGQTYSSEWAHPTGTRDNVVWRLRPRLRYQSSSYGAGASEPRPKTTTTTSAASAASAARQLVVECYCGGGGDGGAFMGRCQLSEAELFSSPADRPAQSSVRGGPGLAPSGQLSFFPVIAQVERLSLALADVVLRPNPLEHLAAVGALAPNATVDNTPLYLSVHPPASTGAATAPVAATYIGAGGAEWAGALPRLSVTATVDELVGGAGLECRLYTAAASTVGAEGEGGLVGIGRFVVRPAIAALFRDRYGEGNGASFHCEVTDLPPSGGAAAALVWARGVVERLAGGFVYQQPVAAGPLPSSPAPPARGEAAATTPPAAAGRWEGARNSATTTTINGSSSAAPSEAVESSAAAGPVGAPSESQVLDSVVAQQAALVEDVKERLRAVQGRKAALQAELARVKEQEAAEMRAAAEARGALETERAECEAQLQQLHEQREEVLARRHAVEANYAERDAERRAAAERAVQERAEVDRIRRRLVELQREMGERLRVEEQRYSSRLADARAAGAQAQQGTALLQQVERRLAEAEAEASRGGPHAS